MSYISCDIESDGPVPGIYSMISFGAVVVDDKLDKTFYREVRPTSGKWIPEALAISGFTREEHEKFGCPIDAMKDFSDWLKENSTGQPIFIADNPGFDFAWISYYFHLYLGECPFGWSSRRIGDLFCGFYNDTRYQWKKHRKYKFNLSHSHNALDDSKANAAALLYLRDQGLKIKLE
jgi:DNA polymerase III epsilon subunit-like protein